MTTSRRLVVFLLSLTLALTTFCLFGGSWFANEADQSVLVAHIISDNPDSDEGKYANTC